MNAEVSDIGYHIVGLQVENLKRIVAINIKPGSGVVKITGKNANGKSSILDAIWWALAGARHIQSVPIRRGQNEARIRLDLGEIIVTRRFKKDAKGEITTGVVVESAKGARFTSPQDMLNDLLGELCMDPQAFSRLGNSPEGKRVQLRELQKFVPGYNFAEQDGLNKADFERRTEVNKLVLQSKAAADLVNVPEDTPDEEENEAALVLSLEDAGKQNALNAKRRENRIASEARLKELRDAAELAPSKLGLAINDVKITSAERIERLRKEIEREEAQLITDIARLRTADDSWRAENQRQILDIESKFASADEIPPDTDTDVIRANIATARTINIHVRRKQECSKHVGLFDQYTFEAAALTDAMNARTAAKRAAIAAATMPVQGLGFGEDEILLNGLPFDQASDAERLRTSVAVAIAQKPKLKVMRIREGSLLDSEGMGIVEEMAAEAGMQIWVECVSDGKSDGVSFVIEDGKVISEPVAA